MSYTDKYLKYKQKYTEAVRIQKYKDMVGGGGTMISSIYYQSSSNIRICLFI